jgi:CubicO group peptidase (beta-lactamase class C family)
VLLAHIVEQVAGEPYARFLQHRIFHPLGMASTGAGNRAPHPEQQAQGYAGEEPAPSFELDTVALGAGDIWTTTRDLARWDAALAAPGLLSAGSLESMFAPQATVPDEVVREVSADLSGVRYGYGWFIGEVEGHRLWFHPGENAGFHSISMLLRDDEAMVLLLLNEEANPFEISLRLVTEVLGSLGRARPREP